MLEYNEFHLCSIVNRRSYKENARNIEIQHHATTDYLIFSCQKRTEDGWVGVQVTLSPEEYEPLANFFHFKQAMKEADDTISFS